MVNFSVLQGRPTLASGSPVSTSPKLAATFAHALRSARAARGMTQAELAERADMAVEAYGRLERGNGLPRTDTLVTLSRKLGVSTDELLGLKALDASGAAEAAGRYETSSLELRRLVHKLERVPARHLRLFAQLASALRSAG